MARGRSRKPKKMVLDDPKDEYLSLFVHDQNGVLKGETIGIEADHVVIKDKGEFYKTPLSNFKIDGRVLRAVKDIDWDIAKKKGEGWRKKELDPLWGEK